MTRPGPSGPSRDEILTECHTMGISRRTPVIFYCFKGARTSSTFVALKEVGVRDVRTNFGSCNEWSRDPALPIDEELLTDSEPIQWPPKAHKSGKDGGK